MSTDLPTAKVGIPYVNHIELYNPDNNPKLNEDQNSMTQQISVKIYMNESIIPSCLIEGPVTLDYATGKGTAQLSGIPDAPGKYHIVYHVEDRVHSNLLSNNIGIYDFTVE